LKLLGIEIPLEELETIYNESAKKMDEIVNDSEINEIKKK